MSDLKNLLAGIGRVHEDIWNFHISTVYELLKYCINPDFLGPWNIKKITMNVQEQ